MWRARRRCGRILCELLVGAVPALCALGTRFCAEPPRSAPAQRPPAVVRLEVPAADGLETARGLRGAALSSHTPH